MATTRNRTRAPAKRVATAPASAVSPPVPPVAPRETPAAAPLADIPAVAKAVQTKAASAVETVVQKVTETIAPALAPAASHRKETIMTKTTETGQKIFADMNERAKAAVSKGQEMFADANEFNKGNVEALVESGKIAVAGFQSLGQDAAEYGRKSFETATAAFKGMAQVKSPTELAKLHADFVRGQFDSLVAEASRSTEAMLKLAGEVAQPISNRFAVAAEKVKIAA